MGIFDWIKFNLYLRKLKRNKLPNDIKNPNGENVTYYPNGKLKEKFNLPISSGDGKSIDNPILIEKKVQKTLLNLNIL